MCCFLVEFPCICVVDISAAFFAIGRNGWWGALYFQVCLLAGKSERARSRLSFALSDHKREASSNKMNPLPPVTIDRSSECDRELSFARIQSEAARSLRGHSTPKGLAAFLCRSQKISRCIYLTERLLAPPQGNRPPGFSIVPSH